MLGQIKERHEKEEHQNIIGAIEALPREEWGYELTCLLARAYNYVTPNEPCEWQLNKAVSLHESEREEGKDDLRWHFRMGYARYYLYREEKAFDCFRRVVELDPNHLDAQVF